MAGPDRKKLLGQILKEMRLVHEGQIQEALGLQKAEGGQIGGILVDLGYIQRGDLMAALATQLGIARVDLVGIEVPEELVRRMDAATVNIFHVVPFAQQGNLVKVAVADPTNLTCLDDVRFMLGADLEAYYADPDQIDALIKKHFQEREETMDSLLDELEDEVERARNIDDQESLAKSTPVVKLLNYVLFMAIRDKASDIHLEPFDDEFKIRYRIDGVLFELRSPPAHLATALISRVKVMANLDIAETRIPQDGRIDLMVGGRKVDVRVSTLPTMYGESCVMRVLDKTVVNLDLERLGLREDEVRKIRGFIDLPHGIILVTGPTGAGKTTTLYAALNAADSETQKIITTEDPVEYELPDIVQVQVNEDIGVTYAACLRSILRQDPDKILVGEIRDRETAQIAVEASLTGHVVFSTLHTNDASSAITRLVDIGVEPFLIAATLEAVVAQRLVRTICPGCKASYEPPTDVLDELRLTRAEVGQARFFSGKGCPECYGTGYRGRMALFEILTVTDRVKEAIIEGASANALSDIARGEGMRSLRDSGLLAVFEGRTTPEEVIRETVQHG
ncbi:MAG: type II/IV secretion system protein [Planctomycetes bacterium]|nr:type II/IV secretion system protein [Planctomycetota bacterium]